jgi:hypothetical protein
MKLILTVLIIAQIYGAFSTSVPYPQERGLMDIWDLISPIAIPVALGIDNAIATVSNAHAAVSNAVTEAIYSVTSWIGGKLPPLGKRDLEIDARLNLLTELKSFQLGFQQSIIEIIQSVLNGSITSQFQQILAKLTTFLKTHINNINNMITNLIPTMRDTKATQAVTSCLHAVQVIEEASKKIHALFSL